MHDNLEDYKVAFAFLLQKHKLLQNKYLDACKFKIEFEVMKQKVEAYNAIGVKDSLKPSGVTVKNLATKNNYLVKMMKLMKTDFEQVINSKESELERLHHENTKLRELLKLHTDLGTPTHKGTFLYLVISILEILNEMVRHEVSLQMRDEVGTQTEIKQFFEKQVNTEEVKSNKTLKLSEDDDSSDGHLEAARSTSNLLTKRSNQREETKKSDYTPKILTTSQAREGMDIIHSKDNKIFSTLVHGSNKKSTIFSVKKTHEDIEDDDDDPYRIKVSSASKTEKTRVAEDDSAFRPINTIQRKDDDRSNSLNSSDEVEIEDEEQINHDYQNDIPEIFKNSEIRDKTGGRTKPRYVESDGEGEYDFYDESEMASHMQKNGKS